MLNPGLASVAAAIGVSLFFLLLIVAFALYLGRHSAPHDFAYTLQKAAKHFPKMTVVAGKSAISSSLRFPGQGWTAIVHFSPSTVTSSGFTRVQFKFDHPTPAILVKPQRAHDSIRKLQKMKDIEIGVPKFDRRFLVCADPEKFAREFLDNDSRKALNDLHSYGKGSVFFKASQMRGQVMTYQLFGAFRLTTFLRRAFRLADRIVECFPVQGMNIMEEETTDPGKCLVCGTEMKRDRVSCRRCRTPHHQECWDYFGSCSTFGCPGEEFESTPT